MVEPNNGQSESAKPKRHNAKLCPTEKREAIINGLAAGKSKRAIARECKASHSTVDAIEQKEWAQVSARKQMLASKHERTAVLALDELLYRLETRPGEIPTPVLNIIGGTSTDKSLALRGDSLGTIRHIHSIDPYDDDDIVAFAVALSHPCKENEEQQKRIKEIGIEGFARVRRKLREREQGAASPKVIEAEIVTDQEGG